MPATTARAMTRAQFEITVNGQPRRVDVDLRTTLLDLLREHLASVGCDPLALRIVTELRCRAGLRDGLDDLRGRLPGCHPAST